MWMSAILSALGLLPKAFDTLNGVVNAIRDEKIVQLNAKTDQERIASQERQTQLEARRDVLIAEASNPRWGWINASVRLLLALNVILLTTKLLTVDKVIGSLHGCTNEIILARPDNCYLFRTDALGQDLWGLVALVFGFYFLSRK